MSSWCRELVALLLVAVLLLAALFSQLFHDPFAYFSTDNAELYFAWLVMLSRALHEKSFPFLNPFAFAGSLPLAPLESGAMYPVTLLAAVLMRPGWSLDSIYFVFLGLSGLHYLLGACSMYALLRRSFVLELPASMLGALCYAFGGSLLGRFSHQPVLFALAWLPLAVGAAKVFTETGRLRTGGLAVAAVWLLGVSSHPQIFLYCLSTVIMAVLWFSVTRPAGLRWGALRRGGIMVAVALGLLAPRLLPLVELSRVAMRPAPTYTIASLFDSLSPLYYLTLLVPGIFGRHVVGYWGTDHPLGNWDSLLYLGLLPLLCACFAFLHRPRRDWQFALLGAGATVFLMLGKHWAVSAWVNQHLPLSSVLTGLSKLTTVFHFFLALMAAFGAQALLDRRRRASILVTAVAVAVIVTVVLAWLSPGIVADLAPAGRRPPSTEAVQFAVQSVHLARLLAIAALLALLGAILAPRTGRILFVPVLVADLTFSLGQFNPIEVSKGDPATYYAADAATRLMQRDHDVFRVANVDPPNGGMVFGLEAIFGYHTLVTTAYAAIHSFFDVQDRRNRPMYNLANIKYQRLGSDLSTDDFTRVAPGLWLNRESFPRVLFIGQCRGFDNTDAMTGYARSPSFDPAREVMLLTADCPRGPAGRGSCLVQSAAENRERYVADCTVDEARGWAFWSIVQYPGWTAVIDGHPVDPAPADIGFYAVPLSAGRHRVELVYRSRGFAYGLWIATATGILAVLLTAWRRREDQRATETQG